ncbi:MAG: 23S rRNA (guanosine(2251)-2'-O)-methyltransferase RlmB [Rhodospirillales bacterium]|nr:MAG: 23S rRNA (guanosine(2251)-2'-O)-methyltransferase RlmB [Rhodospirillales bacterium]
MSKRKHRHGGSPIRKPDREGATWLFGTHAVLAAIANPDRTCRRLVAVPVAADTLAAAAKTAAPPRPAVELLDPRGLEALLPPGSVHQGVAVLAEALAQPGLDQLLQDLGPDTAARVIVLDQASDPRNVGAVLRSAAAFGAAAMIVQDRHAPAETGTLAKAASGALEVVPMVAVTNIARSLERLKNAGFWCLGLAGDADRPLPALEPMPRLALVMGAEGPGLRRLVRETCDVLARIPMQSGGPGRGVDSLNVSVAAAIALYELARHDLVAPAGLKPPAAGH